MLRSPEGGVPFSRSGVAMVLVMSLVLLVSFFSGVFFMLASGETDRTAALTREIQATVVGEAVAARISTLVNRYPWKNRFFLKKRSSDPDFVFNQRTFPFGLESGAFRSDIAFLGSVADLPDSLTGYRLKLEVSCQGQRVNMVWDKVYPQSLLGVTSDDSAQMSSNIDPSRRNVIDEYVDGIRTTARINRVGVGEIGTSVDGALDERRSNRNPGRQIIEGASR